MKKLIPIFVLLLFGLYTNAQLLSEDFETVTTYTPVAIADWDNVIEVGAVYWEGREFSSNLYAQMSSYNTGEANAVWLVTPAIDLSGTNNETFSFDVNIGYWTHDALTVLISTDYAGDPTTATWDDITANFTIPQEPTGGYGTFATAGTMDISAYSGTVNIAFLYTGDDNAGETTTIQIDNVVVNGDEIVINTFPYTESFDDAELPAGWSNEYVTATVNWITASANGSGNVTPRTGANMALFLAGSGPATKLVTPKIDLSSLTTPQLTFYFTNENWAGDIDELRVYYKTSAAGSWTLLGDAYTAEYASWQEVIVTLPEASAEYYLAFEGTSNWGRGVTLDDLTIEEAPANPIFAITPETYDFGQVENGTMATQEFTVTNTGQGTLTVEAPTLDNATGMYSIDAAAFPASLGNMETATYTVTFAPTASGVYTETMTVNYNDGAAQTFSGDVTGEGYVRPAGSTCGNPYAFVLPVVDYSDNTEAYGNDYTSSMVNPSSSYLNGYDFVGQFTVDELGELSGSVAGSWTGLFILQDCPDAATPAEVLVRASGSSGGSFEGLLLEPGTYYAIVSTWPSPDFTDFTLNLSITPVLEYDAELISTNFELLLENDVEFTPVVEVANSGLYTSTFDVNVDVYDEDMNSVYSEMTTVVDLPASGTYTATFAGFTPTEYQNYMYMVVVNETEDQDLTNNTEQGYCTALDFIYVQDGDVGTGLSSQYFEEGDTYNAQAADDFIVPAGETFSFNAVQVKGAKNDPAATDFEAINVFFYNDDAGLPGDLLYEFNVTSADDDLMFMDGVFSALLPETLEFTEGTYWVSFQAVGDYATYNQWWIYAQSTITGTEGVWQNPDDGFGTGATTWTPISTAYSTVPYDLIYGMYYYEVPAQTYTVTFEVTDGTDPVQDATVSINGETLTTGASGMADIMLEDGTYTYTVTAGGYEEATGDVTVAGSDIVEPVVLTYVGTSNLESLINVFPNPSTGTFNIQTSENVSLQVLDITGKVLKAETINGSKQITINTAGIYFFKFSNENGTTTQRVVVQ